MNLCSIKWFDFIQQIITLKILKNIENKNHHHRKSLPKLYLLQTIIITELEGIIFSPYSGT
jgi:hypothetical protein